jgi:DNA polymerase III epsilon subunit-like protein
MSSLLFIDIESTSLGPNAAVIEIALIPYIDGEIKPHYQSYIRPHDRCTMDARAFEINKIDPSKLMEFPDAKTVIKEILDFVDSYECVFSLSGHNLSFDSKKFYNFFCRNAEYSSYINRFRCGGVCTLLLAKNVFKGKRNKPEGFSLEKLCKFFEIELLNSHSALPDIEATIKLYEHLLPKIPPIQNQEIAKLSYQEMKRKYMNDLRYIQRDPDGGTYFSAEAMTNDVIRGFLFTELYAFYEQSGHNDNISITS